MSHGNHGRSDVTHVVITVSRVADVKATITDANEVNIHVVFGLLAKILLDPVLDGHVGVILDDDDVDSTLAAQLLDSRPDGIVIHAWLHNREGCQSVNIRNHGKRLLQDFLSNFGAIEEDAPAIAVLDGVHVVVLQDGHSDWLLSKILDGSACDREVTKSNEMKEDC